MLELNVIKKQLARFGGLDFQPTNPEGWIELAKVLQRRCLTIGHVERVVDRWLETEVKVPKPAQLASLANDVPADETMERPILPDPCNDCAPEGIWRSVQRLDKHGHIFDCAARCTCARGRQLEAMDARRKIEEEARNHKRPSQLTLVTGTNE